MPFSETYSDVEKCNREVPMHKHQKMTPARMIISAVGVGFLAWLGILVLRILPGVLEPFIVEQLQAFLVQFRPGCTLQPWHGFFRRLVRASP